MTNTVVIIDYGSGNLRSAAKAFEYVIRETHMDTRVVVSSEPDHIASADHIVLPGVGAYGDCINGLRARSGVVDAMKQAVVQNGQPFLGICVGMQLLASVGREFGNHDGLGWIDGDVVALEPKDVSLKIPHMGWNNLSTDGAMHPVACSIEEGVHAYFVHSYHMRASNPAHVLATTDYGGPVTAIVGKDNMIGTQFHPEKSQATGLRILTRFLQWKP